MLNVATFCLEGHVDAFKAQHPSYCGTVRSKVNTNFQFKLILTMQILDSYEMDCAMTGQPSLCGFICLDMLIRLLKIL